MRVLLVEDNLERQSAFRKHYLGCVVAANYAQALSALDGAYDLVFLDHDIDFAHNGADVAFHMVGLAREKVRPSLVVVHSSNRAGSLAIHSTLSNAGFRVEQRPYPPW